MALKQPGVRYYGMRSEVELAEPLLLWRCVVVTLSLWQVELAEAYAQAGFYAYPSDKPETSGIALMKAQARGGILGLFTPNRSSREQRHPRLSLGSTLGAPAVRAEQACGCVPLTSGQRASALPETCGAWDLGPAGRDGLIARDPEWQQEYGAHVAVSPVESRGKSSGSQTCRIWQVRPRARRRGAPS